MYPGCDTEVILNIASDTRANHASDVTVNNDERVNVNPNTITWKPWKYYDTFEVSVDADWNTNLPANFYLRYTLSSQDAAAFRLPVSYTNVIVWYDDDEDLVVD